MKRQYLHILKIISLMLFAYILLQGVYQGLTTSAKELDSLMYHIPIAKSYLTGDIFSSPISPILHRFFPGIGEGILALFILFHIPLNLFNVLAVFSLGVVSYHLGKRIGLHSDFSFIFAAGFSCLTAFTRWFNTQIIDIWFVVFYAGALYFILKPGKKFSHFLLLGTCIGLMVGTKYSGPFLAVILICLFGKNIVNYISLKNILLFFLPFSIFGLFWYARNYVVTGNPFYPLAFFFFPGVKNWALEEPVWKAVVLYPVSMMSAFVSEYLGWSLAIFSVIKLRKLDIAGKLILLGLLNLIVYLFLPNGSTYTVHVSNLRYAAPVMLPFILWVFLNAKEKNKEVELSFFAITNIIFSLQFAYHPKLIFAYVFILLISAFFKFKKVI